MADETPDDEIEDDAETVPAPPSDEVAAAVLERFPAAVFHDSLGQAVVYVPAASWSDLAVFLREEQQFTMCMDVTAVDHLLDAGRVDIAGVEYERFEVVANFLSHPRNRRIRAIAQVSVHDPTIASITPVYAGVNFAEREVFDLYGIEFSGHPDLTRIQMPDDWIGHPLRKDDSPARIPVTFKEDNPSR